MKALYPSWSPSYRKERAKEYRAKLIATLGREEYLRRKNEEYEKTKLTRRALLRKRYATDKAYREKCKAYARNFYKSEDAASMFKRKAKKKEYYLKTRDHKIQYSRNWITNNREFYLKQCAKRRKKHRLRNRELARQESLNLTDSYIRNQLSKYSEHSTNHWTQFQVDEKRRCILDSRAKRLSPETVKQIIKLHTVDLIHRDVIAARFRKSPSLIWLILKNQAHKTDRNTPMRASVISAMSKLALIVKASKAIANE